MLIVFEIITVLKGRRLGRDGENEKARLKVSSNIEESKTEETQSSALDSD